ncbi:F510_1955 family glycosylhydrolase [Nocardioides sp. NPDC057767]|uniref:F510_1955 family glycosylhydrolase n=1 Tax=Nocardioides sp. NPDC057767 TaxID=3346244 RepID=UPI00366CC194
MNRTSPVALTIVVATALLSTACGADPRSDRPADDGRTENATRVGHIHGLGVDPADDTLYVATHFGLFRVDETGEAERVADRWQDTMGFTVVGPGHFLGSGHPDMTEDLPPHLGLIESTDAGESWTPLALQGEADFHILEPAGEILYAYDSTSGRLLRTEDRKQFEEILTGDLVSVAATENAEQLYATTGKGRLISIDASTGRTQELDGPATAYVDITAEGDLVGIGPDGVVRVGDDTGQSWQEAGSIGGPPAAFTITEQGWYAATAEEAYRSSDDGESWKRVL